MPEESTTGGTPASIVSSPIPVISGPDTTAPTDAGPATPTPGLSFRFRSDDPAALETQRWNLAGIRARVEAATPGPWEFSPTRRTRATRHWVRAGWCITHPKGMVVRANVDAADVDGLLFAHAPADIAALLDIAEAAEAVLIDDAEGDGSDTRRRMRILERALLALEKRR